MPFGSVTPRHRALAICCRRGFAFRAQGGFPALPFPSWALWTLLAASQAPVIRFCQEEPWWFQELPSEVELKLRMRLWSTRAWGQLVLPTEGQPGLGHLEPALMKALAKTSNLPKLSLLWALQALVAAGVGFCWSTVHDPHPTSPGCQDSPAGRAVRDDTSGVPSPPSYL